MKKTMVRISLVLVLALGALSLAATIFAQSGDIKIRLLHAAEGGATGLGTLPTNLPVDILVDGTPLLTDFEFKNISPYVTVAGTETVAVNLAASLPIIGGTPVFTASLADLNLMPGEYTIAAAWTDATKSAGTALLFEDDNTTPGPGQAKIRFLHLSPDTPTVLQIDAYDATGTQLIAANVIPGPISYTMASGYATVPAGSYQLLVTYQTGMTGTGTLGTGTFFPRVTANTVYNLGSNSVSSVFALGSFADGTLSAVAEVDAQQFIVYLPVIYKDYSEGGTVVLPR